MCGLCGLLQGPAPRARADRAQLEDLFSRLLVLSEHRGPHATGAAWVRRDGTYRVDKAPLPARRFLQTACYAEFLNEAGADITVLMGHTRWPTRGSVSNPANNHPIVLPIPVPGAGSHSPSDYAGGRQTAIGQVALTHNGHLLEVQRHFRRLQLPRTADVDSELLARLAQRYADGNGLDLPAFLDALAPLDGRISLALVATTRPDEILLLKGNMPLEVRVHDERQVLCYASEARILDVALGTDHGWEPLPLASGEGLVVHTQEWTMTRRGFTFRGIEADDTAAYTGRSPQCAAQGARRAPR